MIEKMTKYSWILLSGHKDLFLEDLRKAGVVDITRTEKPTDEASEKMLVEITRLRQQIKDLRAGKDSAREALLSERKKLKEKYDFLQIWGEFDRGKLSRTGIDIKFYCVAEKRFDPSWPENFALVEVERKEGIVWFAVLNPEGFPLQELAMPQETLSEAETELHLKEEELKRREEEIRTLEKSVPEMEASLKELESEFSTYLASLKGQSEAEGHLIVFEGFAPSTEDGRLAAAFNAVPCLWFAEKACTEDNPPIKLRNNRFVRMFEVLTDMYGRPAYDGFDPTPYISIFFLLFFAMCIGDAAYGLILVLIGVLLKKVQSFRSLSPLVVTLGIGSVIVGLFFHSFFSTDMLEWSIIPDGVKRLMLPASIGGYDGTMVLALAVGIVHLCLAMIVKTIYATKNRGFLNSLSIWGWTVFLVGSTAAGAVALAGVIDKTVVEIIIIVLGCISALGIFFLNDLHRNPLKNVGAGLWETYNTATGLLGDVLSYVRLYALGLAGMKLGFAFNNLAVMARGDGGTGWIFFVLIAVIGHSLNVAMAILGAFVHPLRLNFLEFFKNTDYKGTGRKYNPLKK